ncbi:MAG: hypothetical protein C0392_08220 [Syntrophus sp. (in: bacteria)]|nr:hypothetical protein [Syntrophus sp. (in: bacteria)]
MEPALLINQLNGATILKGKGRGDIKILHAGDLTLACRKYVHGGLLRAFTGDIFFSEKRALQEMEAIRSLRENGFPAIEPFCVIVEKRFFAKTLYLVTVFKKDASDLLEFLKISGQMTRFRALRKVAQLFFSLELLGVYHPDLHLNNVLVTPEKALIFLDFDKSRTGPLAKNDMARMFWRLNRFAEKMERMNYITITLKEKAYFLRVYRRLSGYDMVPNMEKGHETKKVVSRIGWFIERIFYGKVRPPVPGANP